MAGFCANCGSAMSGGPFCGNCGARVTPPAPQPPAVPHMAAPGSQAPAPRPPAPQVAAGRAPAQPTSGSNLIVKILFIVLGLIVLFGLIGMGSCIYLGYRAKKKADEIQEAYKHNDLNKLAGALGVNTENGGGSSGKSSGAGSAGSGSSSG
jgi:uncharacterized membrane protein YgcG